METEKKLKLLQLFYSGVLADSISYYERFGILEDVTNLKKTEQKLAASGQLAQLGIDSPEKIFAMFTDVFGCITWNIEFNQDSITARGNNCLLCAISKKKNTQQPCNVYCINPVSAMVEALGAGYSLKVKKTLWNSSECEFEVQKTVTKDAG